MDELELFTVYATNDSGIRISFDELFLEFDCKSEALEIGKEYQEIIYEMVQKLMIAVQEKTEGLLEEIEEEE